MRTKIAVMTLGLLAAAMGAAAQDQTAPRAVNALLNPCPETPGLILCLVEDKSDKNSAAPPALIEKTPRSNSKLIRFTRLAGMFMGRVTVTEIGGVSLRINLELR